MARWIAGWFSFVTMVATCGVGGGAFAQRALDDASVPGSQQADRHDPSSRNYADFSRGYSQDQFRRIFGQNERTTPSHSFPGRSHVGVNSVTILVSPFGYGPYLYSPSAYYSYAIGTDSGSFGPYIAPPIFASGDAQFGPRAVQRFMGVDPVPGPAAQPAPRVRRGADTEIATPQPAPASDARARLKAWQLIDRGDAEFVAHRFPQALSRYREAAAAARDLGEAQFRQGFALVATARFADAAKAFRRGLVLDPDWADSEFRLDELYGANKADKAAHLDALRKAVTAHPHDADLLFVLGVCLYFDGQIDAAAPILRRAANVLGPLNDDSLTGFFKHLPSEKKAAPNAAVAPKPGAVNPPANNGAANAVPPRIPPPPLPAEDKPANAKPPEKRVNPPIDPFDALGR